VCGTREHFVYQWMFWLVFNRWRGMCCAKDFGLFYLYNFDFDILIGYQISTPSCLLAVKLYFGCILFKGYVSILSGPQAFAPPTRVTWTPIYKGELVTNGSIYVLLLLIDRWNRASSLCSARRHCVAHIVR